MDCLIHLAMSLCLIQPSGLTLSADISSQVAGEFDYWNAGHDYHGGKLGRVQISMPLLVGRHFSLDAGIEHSSLLDTGRDRGQERATLGLVFHPFGGIR